MLSTKWVCKPFIVCYRSWAGVRCDLNDALVSLHRSQGETPLQVGSAIDELIRHQPTLQAHGVEALMGIFRRLCLIAGCPEAAMEGLGGEGPGAESGDAEMATAEVPDAGTAAAGAGTAAASAGTADAGAGTAAAAGAGPSGGAAGDAEMRGAEGGGAGAGAGTTGASGEGSASPSPATPGSPDAEADDGVDHSPGHLRAVWEQEPWTAEDRERLPQLLINVSKMMETVMSNSPLCEKLIEAGALRLLVALIKLPCLQLTAGALWTTTQFAPGRALVLLVKVLQHTQADRATQAARQVLLQQVGDAVARIYPEMDAAAARGAPLPQPVTAMEGEELARMVREMAALEAAMAATAVVARNARPAVLLEIAALEPPGSGAPLLPTLARIERYVNYQTAVLAQHLAAEEKRRQQDPQEAAGAAGGAAADEGRGGDDDDDDAGGPASMSRMARLDVPSLARPLVEDGDLPGDGRDFPRLGQAPGVGATVPGSGGRHRTPVEVTHEVLGQVTRALTLLFSSLAKASHQPMRKREAPSEAPPEAVKSVSAFLALLAVEQAGQMWTLLPSPGEVTLEASKELELVGRLGCTGMVADSGMAVLVDSRRNHSHALILNYFGQLNGPAKLLEAAKRAGESLWPGHGRMHGLGLMQIGHVIFVSCGHMT